MKFYYCDHCDTGCDETQLSEEGRCPYCDGDLEMTADTKEEKSDVEN